MVFFCISMALLYALCAENSVPVTDAIFGVRARTRAQPRAHSVIKVCRFISHLILINMEAFVICYLLLVAHIIYNVSCN